MDAERSPRLARRKLATRERIVREALELFGRHGFGSTTVDAIVARADVAKGTFFNYFPRKEAILAHLLDARLRAAVSNASDLLSVAIPVRDKLLDLFGEAASGLEDDPPHTRVLVAEEAARALSPAARHEYVRHWNLLLEELIAQGRRSGEFRARIEPQRARVVLNAIYVAALQHWSAAAPGRGDLRAEIRQQLLLVLDGLSG
jgi:AcrR family transcriptional regulator